jgi:hypothetical protein
VNQDRVRHNSPQTRSSPCRSTNTRAPTSRAAADVRLDAAANAPLRHAFALACIERIAYLLEEPRAIAAAPVLRAFVAGTSTTTELEATRDELQRLTNGTRGRSMNCGGSPPRSRHQQPLAVDDAQPLIAPSARDLQPAHSTVSTGGSTKRPSRSARRGS